MLGKRILFVSKGESTSSTRYRALQFFPVLRTQGYLPSHVTASGGLRAVIDTLRQAGRADIVVVLRKTFPLPLLWLLRRVSRRLIFDLDDAIFCNPDGSFSATRMKRFAAIAKASDHIFAGNRFLAEKSMMFNAAVSVIPTCLDVEKYNVDTTKPKDHIDLVWIGSKSTRKYLVDALPALELAAQRIPRLRLKIIADFDLPQAAIPTLAVPWNAATEAWELASAHIGIAPMRNDDWSRGKCALKVLQYMAAGLPVVSSNAGVNAEVVTPGVTGYLVSTPDEWAQALHALASDENLRLTLGNNGRKRVKQDYDVAAIVTRLKTVLENL
jgi:glycosyltransferase involved in cell wall biosynthesis